MGKLTITGKSKREVAYDTAILSVRFNTHSNTSAEALKTITKQSEEFLNILNDFGISAESIQLGDSHVDQDYDDGKLDAYASKEFKINMLIDMPFINSILELISDKGYAVDVDFEYHVTNEAAIHEELLQEALAKSKKMPRQLRLQWAKRLLASIPLNMVAMAGMFIICVVSKNEDVLLVKVILRSQTELNLRQLHYQKA